MVKKLLLALALLVLPTAAQALCVTPLAGLDATSTSRTFLTVLDGSSNCIATQVIVDGTAGANKAAVKAGSTAVAGTDTALAVGLSPNSPLPGLSNYGTAPGAVSVPGVNAFVTNAATDPCANTKTNVAIATATGTTQLVAPSGSTQVYVCSFSLIAAGTAVINLVGGTGATCTTGTPVAALGSTTAANGMSLAANGGLTYGSGTSTVIRTTTAGHGLCLIQSGTTALAGNITFIQQ